MTTEQLNSKRDALIDHARTGLDAARTLELHSSNESVRNGAVKAIDFLTPIAAWKKSDES